MSYNHSKSYCRQDINELLGCSTTLTIFDPTYDKRDSDIPRADVRPPVTVEGRDAGVETHLARLGVNLVRTGILGIQRYKSSERSLLLLQEGIFRGTGYG